MCSLLQLAVFLRHLGEFVGSWPRIIQFLRTHRSQLAIAAVVAGIAAFFGGVLLLRQPGFSWSPQIYFYLEICGSLLSFFYAANGLVRFRGTHDRTALILAFGFVITGIFETIGSFGMADLLDAGGVSLTRVPMSWMVSRTLLAVLLLTALVVERRMSNSRQPTREIFAALMVVAAAGYLTSAAFLAAPSAPVVRSLNLISRPWDLLPAVLFLLAAHWCWRRLQVHSTIYDYALLAVALLNVATHSAAVFSRQLFDGPFFAAEVFKTASYLVMLCGALLDQARLFDQARRLAVSDPLTGLANYRRLLNALEGELDRSRRTRRPFSVVLLDMDDLKAINDLYGHLVGSRAICRLANVLRINSRAIDTPARYGGDEFVLVLPEAGAEISNRVVQRIRERLAQDGEIPLLSVSAGVAVYPEDGDTPEKLLAAADRELYGMKNRRSGIPSLSRIAACL